MAKKKYYGIKLQDRSFIVDTWAECRSAVHGVKGVSYKSFESREEAQAYIEGIESAESKAKTFESDPTIPVAYVDGSYSHKDKKYSFGCVILTPTGDIVKENGWDNNPQAIENRNVAGELKAAMFAITWACQNQFNKLIIRHDYEGIAKWYNGQWKAKSYCALAYLNYVEKFRTLVDVQFQKVAAHSGDLYNDMADQLAKDAIEKSNG